MKRCRVLKVTAILLGPLLLGATLAQSLTLWTFAPLHATFFEEVATQMSERYPDAEINIQQIPFDTLYDRLATLALAGGRGAPDLVDVEQGPFNRFVGDEMMFEPLDSYLQASNHEDSIVRGKLDLFSWDGQIYGLEHALTPVFLYYRADVFEEHGIETPIETWGDFYEIGMRLQEQDVALTYSPLISSTRMAMADVLLQQRGEPTFDAEGSPNIRTNDYAEVHAMLQRWLDDGIAVPVETTTDFTGFLNQERYVSFIGADWTGGQLRQQVPDQEGLWRIMPLPVFEEGQPRTGTWGGTGLTMLKTSRDKEFAWEFMELAQLTVSNAIRRFELISLYPPLKAALDEPALNEPVSYFGGQSVGAVVADIADEIPSQNPSRARTLYAEAVDAHFFDFTKGDLSAEQFRDAVADELDRLISREQ